VGFTPQLTTCVWFGYDAQGLSLGIGQAAAGVAAPVWSRYMKRALAGEPVMDFPVYAGLQESVVCAKSGLLPTPSCKSTITEVFPAGTVPSKNCDICPAIEQNIDLTDTAPDANISEIQRAAILKDLKKKKKSGSSVLEGIGNELLR
jgi:penicillin-binding protein 1A